MSGIGFSCVFTLFYDSLHAETIFFYQFIHEYLFRAKELTLEGQVYQTSFDLMPTYPQTEVNDSYASLGGTCGQHGEPPSCCWPSI